MKLEVNENCIGCGACAAICPDVFDLKDDGYAYVKVDIIPEEKKEDAMDALEGCPTGAIVEKKDYAEEKE